MPPLRVILQEEHMLRSLCNKTGMGMIEVLIAILLTAVGLITVLSLQSTSLQTMGRSDFLGRASGILYNELERNEALIMNPSYVVPEGTTGPTAVIVSDQAAAVEGDMIFQVTTVIASLDANTWRVTVTVMWPPLNSTGITENIVVTRQDRYRF
jgi:Tfp pilus assembly protein PilV